MLHWRAKPTVQRWYLWSMGPFLVRDGCDSGLAPSRRVSFTVEYPNLIDFWEIGQRYRRKHDRGPRSRRGGHRRYLCGVRVRPSGIWGWFGAGESHSTLGVRTSRITQKQDDTITNTIADLDHSDDTVTFVSDPKMRMNPGAGFERVSLIYR
jgi:hypothetical protein